MHSGIGTRCSRRLFTWACCCSCLIVLVYRLLDFSVDRSDVADYIRWSHDLTSYHSFPSHMPGYPPLWRWREY